MIFLKLNRIFTLALCLVLCLCFTACGDIELDQNGNISVDSAKALAQAEMDKYCNENKLAKCKYYMHNYGEHFPELSSNEKDLFLYFNEAGERKVENGKLDASNDFVVYVSHDGKTVDIIGKPGNNPLAVDNDVNKDGGLPSTLTLFDFSGDWRQDDGESYYTFGADGTWAEYSLDGEAIYDGTLKIENDILQLCFDDEQVYLEVTFENNNCLEEVGGEKLYPYAPQI